MKKLLALLLAVCLIFAGAAGYFLGRGVSAPGSLEDTQPDIYGGTDGGAQDAQEAEAPAENDGDADTAADSPAVQALDYEAMYALHAPEDVVLRIGGRDVTWDRYFYALYSQAAYVEDYFYAMADYYGLSFTWTDMLDEESGSSYMDWVLDYTEDTLLQQYAVTGYAEENGVVLTEADREELALILQEDIQGYCGEDATEEDFWAYLSEEYLSPETYRWINEASYLYQLGYVRLYGETGELYDADAAVAWLEDNGYLSASHILLMTIDPSTGEALDEAAVQAQYAQAEALLAELQAIEDPEARLQRFRELKDEYCEDTGKLAFPDGYTFTPGTMVSEFEDAVNALGDYELSGIVETSYGYHIILRLPLSADSALSDYTDDYGMPLTARGAASNEDYGDRLQAYFDTLPMEYADGFRPPVLTDYVLE